MALADAAIDVCGAANVLVIHIDHGLSAGSARVASDVAAWARERGVACIVRHVVVEKRASLEAAAREARYGAFDAIAQEVGAAAIWTAHTARDQAETVLMRVVRGTGPAGLAGIAAQRGRYVRPLLELPRELIDAYVAARGLPVWTDPMNADEKLARVRFRTKHLPTLRRENPALEDALVRLASHTREWLELIDAQCQPHVAFPLDCAAVAGLPPAVRKRCYTLALEAANLGYEAVHLEQLAAPGRRPTAGGTGIDIARARLVRSYDTLDIATRDTGFHRPATPARRELVAPPGHEVRAWAAGDRMKPARLKGKSRKLSDLFIDLKVPRELRTSARVIVRTQDQVIVWAEYIGSAIGQPFGDI